MAQKNADGNRELPLRGEASGGQRTLPSGLPAGSEAPCTQNGKGRGVGMGKRDRMRGH